MRVSNAVAARRVRGAWIPFLLLLGLVLSPPVVSGSDGLVDLDPERLNRTDNKGLAWDPQADGMLRDGSNDCFDGGLELTVNEKTFTPNLARKMTPDASELVLHGRLAGV